MAANVVFQGNGVIVVREGDDALIRLPGVYKAEGKPSSTGKSKVCATTGGNQPIGDSLMLGLNAYKRV